MKKTKENIEKILKKIEENQSMDCLSEEEGSLFNKLLREEDTRCLSAFDLYGKTEKKSEVVKFLDKTKITSENYKDIRLPGIRYGQKKTRISNIEKEYSIELKKRGFTNEMISVLIDRTIKSVENIHSEINKEENTFGTTRTNALKYEENRKFFNSFKEPIRSIFDVYCGKRSFWKNEYPEVNVLSNDLNEKFEADMHEPALYALYKYRDCPFDIVDLDAFTSPHNDFFDAIKIAQKGIILTFGDRRGLKNSEFRNIEHGGTDTIKERYKINRYSEEGIIEYLKSRAWECGKKIEVFSQYSTASIWRVYFKIVDLNREEIISLIKYHDERRKFYIRAGQRWCDIEKSKFKEMLTED